MIRQIEPACLMRILVVCLVFQALLVPETSVSADRHPRLVVCIVIDQMRADYLDRFSDLFGEGGFKRLEGEGARYTNCEYDYAATFTGPGHSVILSGIPVRRSGIIGNEWFDRGRGRQVYCVEDSSVRSVGISSEDAAGRMSPRNFGGTSIGDVLLGASPSSRVIGIAIKDRGAILPAGKHPTGAFWFDPGEGRWITSTYYFGAPPSWLVQYNSMRRAESYLGRRWEKLLPESAYARSGADDSPGEGTIPGEKTSVFPHLIRDLDPPGITPRGSAVRRFDALLPTPFGDELTADFAEAAVEGEQLGQREVTDLLSVSFSSPDYCGHLFGPDSHEIEDLYVRLDRTLAQLLEFLDQRVGLGNVLVVLTADHGVCPLPERAPVRGASRISGRDVLLDLKTRVGQEFNYNEGLENLLQTLSNGFIYIDTVAAKEHRFDLTAFNDAIMRAALKEPNIRRCYTRSEMQSLLQSGPSEDTLGHPIAVSFDPRRSGDVALVPEAYSFFSGGTTGTTHGSPYAYDRHVPLLFFGFGISPGVYAEACRPNDIAPTIAHILGLSPPEGCDGAILHAVTH